MWFVRASVRGRRYSKRIGEEGVCGGIGRGEVRWICCRHDFEGRPIAQPCMQVGS